MSLFENDYSCPMITVLKKHALTLGLLFLSGLVGIVLVFLQTPKDSWLVEYGFDTKRAESLPAFAKADTVFLFEGKLIRNYTTSIGDSLRDKSLSIHEIKITLPTPSTKKQVMELGTRVLDNEHIEVKNARYRETQRNKSLFLYCALFGLFLGMVAEFIRRLKQHPASTKNG